MKTEKRNVAIAELWTKHYELCSFTNGTDEFVRNVYNFYDCLIDLDDDKKAIATKVKRYYDTVYEPELNSLIDSAIAYTSDLSSQEEERQIVTKNHIRKLFRFIIQTIQDSGIGWQSTSRDRGHYELSGFMGKDSD
jgi:hypothetical protein